MPRRCSSLALGLALLTLGLPACSNDKAEAEGKSAKVEAGKAPAAATPTTAGAEAGPDSAAGEAPAEAGADDDGAGTETGEAPEPALPVPEEFEKVGVEACDAYVTAYVACIGDKVPEADREAQRRIVWDNIKSWKQTAAGGAAAERGLLTACKIATEQAKRETQVWACTW